MKRTKVALVYDFDETLSVHYMQDYMLIPELGYKPEEFWRAANEWSAKNGVDQITGSMFCFKYAYEKRGIKLTKAKLKRYGEPIDFYNGVEDWFTRINKYGRFLDLDIEHYIISSGYEEIIEGCKIRKFFKDVYGCAFVFGEDGTPVWPARVVNYSGKIQYLSKINKGLGKYDDKIVNEYMPDEERRIPFKRMIYFGDGQTDIPSMKMVKNHGGNAIAVYQPHSRRKEKAVTMLRENRVNFALAADYREDKEIDCVVKTLLNRIATERDLEELKKKEDKKK
ncbi:MAG: haloacid dehalogenase-like hydrolase, partial [Alphaproteobacteria bacterium]|nr:haloacid dehalogenase-like hydrolase [Alphaproteobacteria bacterium]